MMDDDLPPALKRDKNNAAPFMKIESIGAEGGPFYDLWKQSALDPAKPGADRALFQCTCGLMTGECKRAGCPYKPQLADIGWLSAKPDEGWISPEANPPASPPNWVPPWEAKS